MGPKYERKPVDRRPLETASELSVREAASLTSSQDCRAQARDIGHVPERGGRSGERGHTQGDGRTPGFGAEHTTEHTGVEYRLYR